MYFYSNGNETESEKICDKCQSAVSIKASRCTACGHDTFSTVSSLQSKPSCPRCGEKYEFGTELCSKCGYALSIDSEITRSGTGLNLTSDVVILTTGQAVPGREVAELIGLVFAAGNAAWTLEGTSNKSNTAMGKASDNLMKQAWQLGADAVVAIQMSIDGSGTTVNRSQTVTLIGTAVKLKPTKSNQ